MTQNGIPSTESISTPADKIVFTGSGMKSEVGEVLVGAAFGDMATGPHGTFVRYPPGYVTLPHTHTEDYYAVVISGVVTNYQPEKNEDQTPLSAGSYWFQRAGEVHVTRCLSDDGCLFFLTMRGKFVHTDVA